MSGRRSRTIARVLSSLAVTSLALLPRVARADDHDMHDAEHPKEAKDESGVPKDFPRLVLDDGRNETF
ncbi:MAG: hypothetical protein ABI183_24995, partial [Polyangiaceae bacterium]